MYVVDITRVNKNKYESDMLVGKMTTDTKTKTMNYIIDYALANLQIAIDPELLDNELNMDLFFLKPFIKDNYNLDIKDDLIIQSINANKDNWALDALVGGAGAAAVGAVLHKKGPPVCLISGFRRGVVCAAAGKLCALSASGGIRDGKASFGSWHGGKTVVS